MKDIDYEPITKAIQDECDRLVTSKPAVSQVAFKASVQLLIDMDMDGDLLGYISDELGEEDHVLLANLEKGVKAMLKEILNDD